MRLDGKVAIVTGGGRGIGRGIALAFAHEGCDIALAARTEPQLAHVAAEVRATGRRAIIVVTDVTSSDAIQHLVAETVAQFGGIDILVSNAGGSAPGDVVSIPEAEWRRCIDLNLTSTYLGAKYSIPHLRARGGGNIINISSTRGTSGREQDAPYGAAKAAIIQLTQGMAIDFARDGIRVNCICPGAIATERHEQLYAVWDDPAAFDAFLATLTNAQQTRYRKIKGDPEATRSLFGRQSPMQRRGTVAEVGKTAAFLASDDASFITGAVIMVDGGRSAGR